MSKAKTIDSSVSSRKTAKAILLLVLIIAVLLSLGLGYTKFLWFDSSVNDMIESSCEKYEVNKSLAYSVMKAESNFNKSALSKKGAVGLMQVMPKTACFVAEQLGMVTFDLQNDSENILIGVFYLSYLQSKFDDVKTSIAAYNAGEGAVTEWLKNKEFSSDGVTLKKIPFNETDKYVKKIDFFTKVFNTLHK